MAAVIMCEIQAPEGVARVTYFGRCPCRSAEIASSLPSPREGERIMSDAPPKTPSPRFTARAADDPTYDVDPGKGWVLFAGIMLGVVGVLNLIYGIGAISDSRFYVRDVAYVLGDLNTWGWFLTIIGAAQLVASVGVFMTT